MKRALIFLAVFTVSLTLRIASSREIGPYDDAYHWKRIAYSAAHFPRVLDYDPDRDAWCPWPPLYDLGMSVFPTKCVIWIPPIAFSLFAATLAVTYGWIAGLAVALAPYLIGVSSVAKIDHHWIEPMLVVAIYAARSRPVLLAIAMTCALFIQPALIIACGLLFVAQWGGGAPAAAKSFAFAALAIVIYRATSHYPNNAWFLGWPHAALLTAAAVALTLRPRWYALPIAAMIPLPWLPQIAEGMLFIRGDRWFRSIVEFQPLFHHAASIGTDIANIGGGVIAMLLFARKQRALMIFALAYLALAISSQRFLVPAIAMFAIAGASTNRKWIAAALTLLPPLCYDLYAPPRPIPPPHFAVVDRIATLPPGRVLAPWHLGHAIDVFAHHAVVIDNFGTMPDPMRFELANEALANPRTLRAYCKRNGVRYVVMRGEIWTMN